MSVLNIAFLFNSVSQDLSLEMTSFLSRTADSCFVQKLYNLKLLTDLA
jgi:hypothetical protein